MSLEFVDQLAGMDGCGLDDVASAVGRAPSLVSCGAFSSASAGRLVLKFDTPLPWSGWRFWRYRRW